MTAPIILFVFARPEHTRRTLEALAANPLADQSDLIVYADAARKPEEEARVNEVRALVRSVRGFRSVSVIEHETNCGLARNIIDGVTAACKQYGRVIVLEDDIVTSPHFLTFMNTALDKYEEEKKVWHISGWNYPIDPEGLENVFFWHVMNCWGWATWADRWQHFGKDPGKLIKNWDREKIGRFNLDSSCDFWAQVVDNYSGKLNTWAIFWYASIFERNGLCLNPTRTFVQNIGHDGSGENCGENNLYQHNKFSTEINNFPMLITESTLAIQKVKHFNKSIKRSFSKRLASFITRAIKN